MGIFMSEKELIFRMKNSSTAREMEQDIAQQIASLLQKNAKAVLGLATGGTPLPIYKELVRLHREEGLDFSQATFFNLDEYVGLPPEHPCSYHSYMKEHLYSHINANPKNIHIPNGMASDIGMECSAYEALIAASSGIDLQILGIGENGHIGFNEPGTPFSSRTHLVDLVEKTRNANARFFSSLADVPRQAISMGISTILEAKRIILIANGETKRAAVNGLLYAPISPDMPATALRLHKDVTLVVDGIAFGLRDKFVSFPGAQLA
jgi:glucosamine-6-phosphate deaminase